MWLSAFSPLPPQDMETGETSGGIKMAFKYPQNLVETDWFADHLNDSDIRLMDCTACNRPDGSGGVRAEM